LQKFLSLNAYDPPFVADLYRRNPALKKQSYLDQSVLSAVSCSRSTCQKLLAVSGSIYNKSSSLDRKITHLEIQEWVWNFHSNPSDPEHGKVTNHAIIEIERGKRSRH